jgi:hypothetical protein
VIGRLAVEDVVRKAQWERPSSPTHVSEGGVDEEVANLYSIDSGCFDKISLQSGRNPLQTTDCTLVGCGACPLIWIVSHASSLSRIDEN